MLLLSAAVGAGTRWTRFGRALRAVVDNRRLAVLGGIDADRVAAVGWAFGSFTAGLTGVLLAPYVRLDPYGLPLLVVEVIAVAALARMRSLPVAVAAALLLGVAQAQLTRLHPAGWPGPWSSRRQPLCGGTAGGGPAVPGPGPGNSVRPPGGPARARPASPPLPAVRALAAATSRAAGPPWAAGPTRAVVPSRPRRTTVLRTLAGTVPLSTGRVRWQGADVTRLPAHGRARRGLCFVPDLQAVYAGLTVADNLALNTPPGGTTSPALEAYPALCALLPRLAGTLSGGEQRMLAVSRALLASAAPGTRTRARTRVVLVDEPTLGMSTDTAAHTYALLVALSTPTAVVLAEQRLPALPAPGPVFVSELDRGRVTFTGEASESSWAPQGHGPVPNRPGRPARYRR